MGKVTVAKNLKKEQIIIFNSMRYKVPEGMTRIQFMRELKSGMHKDTAKGISNNAQPVL